MSPEHSAQLQDEDNGVGLMLTNPSLLKKARADTYRCFRAADHLPEGWVVAAARHRLLVGDYQAWLRRRSCSGKTERVKT